MGVEASEFRPFDRGGSSSLKQKSRVYVPKGSSPQPLMLRRLSRVKFLPRSCRLIPKKKNHTMADRFFPNLMPDFLPEKATEDEEAGEDPLSKLLSMPYPLLSERLKRAAQDLKETVSACFSLGSEECLTDQP